MTSFGLGASTSSVQTDSCETLPQAHVEEKISRMTLSPSFAEFAELARGATLVPVWRELLFDTETAVTAYAKIARPPFGFLLESVVGGETWARWTFLGTEPRAAWKLTGRRVESWTPAAGWTDRGESADPLADFDRGCRASGAGRWASSATTWCG
jgi:anthranilate synthase component 1